MPHNETELLLPTRAAAPDHELSAVVVALLKGVLYQEASSSLWQTLYALQSRVRDYVAVLGLELVLDEAEGYAFLRSVTALSEGADDAAAGSLPRLIVRRPLSFPVSLLLALLRKKLAEFDAGGGDTRLILSRDQIVETVRVFLPEGSNEAKLFDQIDTHLGKIVGLGFLRRLKPGVATGGASSPASAYEVRRILKAFVDAQWLAAFDARLEAYKSSFQTDSKGSDDE